MSSSNIPFVDLKIQHRDISDEIKAAIENVVKNTSFVLGKNVADFEESFASFCETEFAVGVDSGTSAIQLALEAFGVGQGHEVITTPNTFIATVCAIKYTGAKPVLVDVDPETYNLDVRLIEGAITERTRAILPVHLYGQPADMDPIMEIARRHDLVVIEDACQAHGARYKGVRVGSMGHAAAFSFYPAKNLGAFGDGGIITTNDAEAARKMLMLRNFGQEQKNIHLVSGYNRRLDALQAAILLVKLKKLDTWNEERVQSAHLYNQHLQGFPGILPRIADYAQHVFHLYVIQVEERDELRAFLGKQNIGAGIHYPVPIHLTPAFEHLGYSAGAFPVSEAFASKIVSLPMFPGLTREQIERVCQLTLEFLKSRRMEEPMATLEPSG